MLSTRSTRSFGILITVILKFLLDSGNIWANSGSSSVDYFLSWQWVIVIFSCFLMYLIIFNWMPDVAFQRTVETGVNSIYTCKGANLSFYQPSVWGDQATPISSWSGFEFYCWYFYLQYTTDFKFLQWWTALVSGMPESFSRLSADCTPVLQVGSSLWSCPSLSCRSVAYFFVQGCGWGRQCFSPLASVSCRLWALEL